MPRVVIGLEKEEYREKIKAVLKSLSPEDRERRSQDVKKRLFSLEIYKKAENVLFYASRWDEPDTIDMMEEAFKEGKRIFLPRVGGEDLYIFKVEDLSSDLERGTFGILEPKENLSQASPRDMEIVLVPGLAFDREKNRLGRGKGYYDRFLRRFPKDTLKVGICFSFQILERLPLKSYDSQVDLIVTDKELIT